MVFFNTVCLFFLLKEKWVIKEERNRLSAEKSAFKDDQRIVIDMLEKQKSEVEQSRVGVFLEIIFMGSYQIEI